MTDTTEMASKIKDINKENGWQKTILLVDSTVQDAIMSLNNSSMQIVLVVDHHEHLIGTISDGDIRRGLLKGLTLESSINEIVYKTPFVVPQNLESEMVVQLMTSNKVHQIPIVGNDRSLLGLHLWDVLGESKRRSNMMVIMAGGKGTRLLPYTENCPKPMILVSGKPMLQHVLEKAISQGFTKFVISIHYLGHMIQEYFGDGDQFGVQIDYICEETALGTAGALSLLNKTPAEPFIVTNGDIITDIKYGEVLDFHIEHSGTATMAVRVHELHHQFGVVKTNGIKITGFEEKPKIVSHINAGVYVLNPEALDELEINERCDMPCLFDRLKSKSKLTIAYPALEPWMDLGMPDDLEKANLENLKDKES